MTTWTINSDVSLQKTIGELRDLFKQHKFVKLTGKTGRARSLDQNAISHCWYEQLSLELPEEDALGWKSFCKLHYGVPLLRAEDAQFRAFYDNAIKQTLTYEQKLDAMRFVPVTSLMTKAQLTKYLEKMQMEFMKRGVQLEFPDA